MIVESLLSMYHSGSRDIVLPWPFAEFLNKTTYFRIKYSMSAVCGMFLKALNALTCEQCLSYGENLNTGGLLPVSFSGWM